MVAGVNGEGNVEEAVEEILGGLCVPPAIFWMYLLMMSLAGAGRHAGLRTVPQL